MSNADVLSGSVAPDLPDPDQTMDLLGRAREGDAEALNSLLARYQDRVLRIARIQMHAHLRSWTESMDIVQATLAVAARKIRDVDISSPGALLSWLSTIALNQIRDEAAKRNAEKRSPARAVPIAKVAGERGTRADDRALHARDTLPEERAWKAELREILDSAVSRLSDDQREVVLLRDYCGAEWTAIARQFDRTISAVQELHRRAWIRIRRIARPGLGGIL